MKDRSNDDHLQYSQAELDALLSSPSLFAFQASGHR